MFSNHSNPSTESYQSAAKQLDPINRQKIAISALAPNENISHISRQYETSRKFIYAQKEKASDALNEVFEGYLLGLCFGSGWDLLLKKPYSIVASLRYLPNQGPHSQKSGNRPGLVALLAPQPIVLHPLGRVP